MTKKKVGVTILGSLMAAGAMSVVAPSMAVATDSAASMDKTSNVSSTMVGETVEFIVTVTGPAGVSFTAVDDIQGYTDNATAPSLLGLRQFLVTHRCL